jgi:predicted ArsR family transcriptional regulator
VTATGDRTRARIESYVERHPGIHLSELERALDLTTGQVQHHLGKLTTAGRLRREAVYGRSHLYCPEYDETERRRIALFRRETARDVALTVVEDGPIRPADVADRLDIARSTLEWHLDRLVAEDVVGKERDAAGRVTLAAVDPALTVALLAEIRPSLPGRFLDRFTRLVDSLVE